MRPNRARLPKKKYLRSSWAKKYLRPSWAGLESICPFFLNQGIFEANQAGLDWCRCKMQCSAQWDSRVAKTRPCFLSHPSFHAFNDRIGLLSASTCYQQQQQQQITTSSLTKLVPHCVCALLFFRLCFSPPNLLIPFKTHINLRPSPLPPLVY